MADSFEGDLSYGSTAEDDSADDVEHGEDIFPTDNEEADREESFRDSKYKREHFQNIYQSKRLGESFVAHQEDGFEVVPTMNHHNVTLVTDPNLDYSEKGKLYYAQTCFFNKDHKEQHYAITVNEDIYQRILAEVADSKAVPCGMYFCCHGGDGAHTGISHDDYVDIRMAYLAVGILFSVMVVIATI